MQCIRYEVVKLLKPGSGRHVGAGFACLYGPKKKAILDIRGQHRRLRKQAGQAYPALLDQWRAHRGQRVQTVLQRGPVRYSRECRSEALFSRREVLRQVGDAPESGSLGPWYLLQ